MNLVTTMEWPQVPKIRGNLKGLCYPCWAEIKHDGEFNYLVKQRKEVYLLNKYGKKRTGIDYLASGDEDYTLIGELCYNTGSKGDLYELLKHKADKHPLLTFIAFDILELNGVSLADLPFMERRNILNDYYFPIATGRIVNNEEELQLYYKTILSAGYEGIIAKDLNDRLVLGNNSWVKLKGKDENDYKITAIDPVRERIEIDASGKTVGVKVVNKYKRELKVGDVVKIEHLGVLAHGGLRNPSYRGKVC